MLWSIGTVLTQLASAAGPGEPCASAADCTDLGAHIQVTCEPAEPGLSRCRAGLQSAEQCPVGDACVRVLWSPTADACVMVPRPDGGACGTTLTEPGGGQWDNFGQCVAGTCVAGPVPEEPDGTEPGLCCDDDRAHTVGDKVVRRKPGEPDERVCFGLNRCDDGNWCTDDAWDPQSGDCVHLPADPTALCPGCLVPCDDGDPCTYADRCVAGVCTGAGAPPAWGMPRASLRR